MLSVSGWVLSVGVCEFEGVGSSHERPCLDLNLA